MRSNGFAAAIFAATFCVADGAPAEQHSDIKAAMEAFETALRSGDGATAAQSYAEDAILLPNDGPRIEGRDGIAGFWAMLYDAGLSDLTLETADIDMLGDTAIETGTWQASLPDGSGGTVIPAGKYLVVWKRGADGGWMPQKDIWNDTPPAE